MLENLKSFGVTKKREIAYCRLLLKDKRTPWPAKALLGLAVGYFLIPFDIIPVKGHLDDLVIVPFLVILALIMTPEEAKNDC